VAELKIESPAFETADVLGFLDELRERERAELLGRLGAIDARLDALAPRLRARPGAGADGWTAHEVLAHMAVLSKFYGVVAHSIASGKLDEFDLLGQVRLRDVAGDAAAAESDDQLLDAMKADHGRTSELLRKAPAGDLYRRAATGIQGLEMSAADVLRLPLVTHLESHLEQLEGLLSSGI
jgi:hypothetical protein